MTHQHVRYLRTLGLLLAAGLVPAASAQNAVGNGRALDNRLQVIHPVASAGVSN